MFKKLTILSGLVLISSTSFATDLATVYQQAAAHNATYQAALKTYNAARYAVPVARGPLLPQLDVSTASYTHDYKANTNTTTFTLSASQVLFDYSKWTTYTKAQQQLKEDAITLQIAEQSLINDAATHYFAVLQAEEQLKYAYANERSLKENLDQAEQQYKVGLKAITDVQSAKAQYETAKAARISDLNDVHNALQKLEAYTGQAEKNLAHLKPNFKKVKPYPADPERWVQTAQKNNLSILKADATTNVDREAIKAAKSGYYPTVDATASYSYSHTSNSAHTNTPSVGVTGALNLFQGGITHYAVSGAEQTVNADQASALQTRRDVASSTYADYLTVLSDMAQIKAYKQSIISGEASVSAAQAQYQVGTTTIYDLLQEQAKLFNSQNAYAVALYKYITDSLQLKTDAGLLTSKDIIAVNKWLDDSPTTTKKKSK